jgi:hypothetical protein
VACAALISIANSAICIGIWAEFDFRYNNRKALGIEDDQRAAKALVGAKGKRLNLSNDSLLANLGAAISYGGEDAFPRNLSALAYRTKILLKLFGGQRRRRPSRRFFPSPVLEAMIRGWRGPSPSIPGPA